MLCCRPTYKPYERIHSVLNKSKRMQNDAKTSKQHMPSFYYVYMYNCLGSRAASLLVSHKRAMGKEDILAGYLASHRTSLAGSERQVCIELFSSSAEWRSKLMPCRNTVWSPTDGINFHTCVQRAEFKCLWVYRLIFSGWRLKFYIEMHEN